MSLDDSNFFSPLSSFMAAVWAALSLLTVFAAPAKPLWYVAVFLLEWPIVALTMGFVLWGLMWLLGSNRIVHVFMVMAQVILAVPSIQSQQMMKDLPRRLQEAFPHGSVPTPTHSPLYYETFEFETAQSVMLAMDMVRPFTGNGLWPVLLVVHGGSWQSGDRKELRSFNETIARYGFAVFSPDYRMAPGAPYPAACDDIRAAINYLKANSPRLSLDASRIAILGRSAGGQIALTVAYALGDSDIRGVIGLYSPNDLIWAYSKPSNPLIMNSQKILEDYLGGPPSKTPGLYENASPVNRVNLSTPPTLIVHGLNDPLVFPHHSQVLAEKLKAVKRPYFYLELPWATHGAEANPKGPSGSLITYAIVHFLKAVQQ